MTLTCTTKIYRAKPTPALACRYRLPLGAATRQRGFTLIELLIVAVILAVAAGLVATNFTGREDAEKLRVEATRLAKLVSLAREEAVLTGQEWGLIMNKDGYQFVVYEPDFEDYDPAPGAHFRRREPEGLKFDIDDKWMGGAAKSKNKEHKAQILLLSSGECTPFRLQIADAYGHSIWLESDGYNEVRPLEADAL